MTSFIHPDFLLSTPAARRLYHEFAEPEPILDYHCHLSPRDLAENRQFANLFEIWLEGDHYKWRAMRANGMPERFITGDASPREKFEAWAATVPQTLCNPLYHWTHLELQRYFGITELLNAGSAARIWEETSAQLARPELSVHGILEKFRVTPSARRTIRRTICATTWRSRRQGIQTRVLPAFRPDKALNAHQPAAFNAWLDQLPRRRTRKSARSLPSSTRCASGG